MDSNWKRQLRREASIHGMCKENRDALEQIQDKGEAVALYKKTIDWALECGYPSLPVLRAEFSDCEDVGIYIDREFHGELLDSQKVYVLHNCNGTIKTGLNVKERIIPMFYFANGCNITLKPYGKNAVAVRVPLYVFGENVVIGTDSEDVMFKTYKFDVL